MLNDIERNKSKLERVNYDKNVTLDEICDDFRSYASSKLKLYYDISDIRRFIAGMAVSHILILQGMSGSPIVQDGKLVGAVTHVFINDSARGYGIAINNMLDVLSSVK